MARRPFAQVQVVCQLCFSWTSVSSSVTHVLVTSHLDYSNVLYMGQSLKSIHMLQLVQNTADWTVLCKSRLAHVISFAETTLVTDLLLVQLKMLVITFKILYDWGQVSTSPQIHRPDSLGQEGMACGRSHLLAKYNWDNQKGLLNSSVLPMEYIPPEIRLPSPAPYYLSGKH